MPWIVEAEAGDIQPIVFYGASGVVKQDCGGNTACCTLGLLILTAALVPWLRPSGSLSSNSP